MFELPKMPKGSTSGVAPQSVPQYNMGTPQNNNGSQRNSNSAPKTRKCSYCGGKGWVAGSRTTTYGVTGTYYCGECGREVNRSHSHDMCPSCGGKGEVIYR